MQNKMNLPLAFSQRMRDMLAEDADAFFEAFQNNPTYQGIRINTLKNDAEKKVLKEIGAASKVLWCDNGYYIDKHRLNGKHPYHVGGLVYFQEPSAMSTVGVLDIKEDDFVLDLCAAPGGKATQASEKLGKDGLLVANEIIPKRALILTENIQRMGIKNAVVTNESPDTLKDKYPEFFDKIIVDAPCSGEGMFKKEPRAIDEWSVEHTLSCANRQKNILDSAIKMLKNGGKLVYSTCTFSPEENEMVVDYILKNYPDMTLLPIDKKGMQNGFSRYSKDFDMSKTKRIFPHKANGEGHFVALFQKCDGGAQVHKKKYVCENEKLYRDFERENLNVNLKGEMVAFGDKLYLLPCQLDIDKIKVLSAGLFLGVCKKGRFQPSHALCLALLKDDFKRTVEIQEAEKFFRGETFNCTKNGWCCVLFDGCPIGWGKASGGVLKNHFPKHLRF